MKTYILTEEQINKALSKKGIKKGIGLKINEGNSFYYKSIIKEFEDENDFSNGHKTIFSVIKGQIMKSQPLDPVIIGEKIKNLGINFKKINTYGNFKLRKTR